MCTQSPSKLPQKGGHKRIDLDCMVIMDIYIKSLERMLMSTGWTLEKTHIPVNYFPTNGWIDQFTQSSGHEPHRLPTSRPRHRNGASSVLLSGCHPETFPVPLFW